MVDLVNEFDLPPSKIYNFDETALFYRCMPKKTLAGPGDDGAGSKEDKINRLTIAPLINGDGSDMKIVMIGKSKTPRNTGPAFWKEHGISYYHNQRACMDQEIFDDFLGKWNDELELKNEFVVLSISKNMLSIYI